MSDETPDQPISPKRERFAQEYIRDLNAKQAAIRAGYTPSNAALTGHRMLRDKRVTDLIESHQQTIAEQVGITGADVVMQVARMAFADPRDVVDIDGKPLPLQHLNDNIAAAITGVDIVPVRFEKDTQIPTAWAYRYKFADKASAAKKLMKHLGLYEKDNAQKVDAVSDFLSAIHEGGSRVPLRLPEGRK